MTERFLKQALPINLSWYSSANENFWPNIDIEEKYFFILFKSTMRLIKHLFLQPIFLRISINRLIGHITDDVRRSLLMNTKGYSFSFHCQ